MAENEDFVEENLSKSAENDLEIISADIKVKHESGDYLTSVAKIQEKKRLVHNWSKSKKLHMLATYSSCKVCFAAPD